MGHNNREFQGEHQFYGSDTVITATSGTGVSHAVIPIPEALGSIYPITFGAVYTADTSASPTFATGAAFQLRKVVAATGSATTIATLTLEASKKAGTKTEVTCNATTGTDRYTTPPSFTEINNETMYLDINQSVQGVGGTQTVKLYFTYRGMTKDIN